MAASSQLVVLYQQMADLTSPECARTCRVPHSCCDEFFCEMTKMFAREEYGIELPDPPNQPVDSLKNAFYLGPNGCTVAPYLRPHCTMHTCDINGLGFKPGDAQWTKRYFRLRNRIVKVESK